MGTILPDASLRYRPSSFVILIPLTPLLHCLLRARVARAVPLFGPSMAPEDGRRNITKRSGYLSLKSRV